MNLKVVVRRQSGNRLIQRSIVKNLIGNGVPPNYRALHPYSYHNDYRKFPRFRFPWGLFLGESPKSTITYLSMDQQETIIIEDTTTDDPNGKSERSPSLWFVHATAIFVQILFGVGNCIGKEALNSRPPIIFAFYRELFAGLILLSICVNDIRFFFPCSSSHEANLFTRKTFSGYSLLDSVCLAIKCVLLLVYHLHLHILLLFGKQHSQLSQ